MVHAIGVLLRQQQWRMYSADAAVDQSTNSTLSLFNRQKTLLHNLIMCYGRTILFPPHVRLHPDQ
jgi:hypothetical protein